MDVDLCRLAIAYGRMKARSIKLTPKAPMKSAIEEALITEIFLDIYRSSENRKIRFPAI
ncbi:MAG: hypothetical protein HC894_31960 [Microcoleus sp. SM1_3_4]|nr:hypothetical protein [Microcoleus sp. SM1_3_4]